MTPEQMQADIEKTYGGNKTIKNGIGPDGDWAVSGLPSFYGLQSGLKWQSQRLTHPRRCFLFR